MKYKKNIYFLIILTALLTSFSPLLSEVIILPHGISVSMGEGDVEEVEVIVANIGDADIVFSVDIDQVDREDNFRQGPHRDDPPESVYALFQQINPWGGNIEALIFQEVDGLEYERFGRNDFENLDLDEFDVIWISHNQHDDAWNRAYNDNRERFEDWVDGGGVYYASIGTNNYDVVPIHPGGLGYTEVNNSSNGRVQVSEDPDHDDYNYLAELMEWEPNTQLRGNSLFHSHYTQDDVDDLDNSDWHQVIVDCEDHQAPGIIVYSFGRGFCVVAGTTDGHQHAHNDWSQPPNWGSAGEELIYYLDFLSVPSWIFMDQDEYQISAGEEAVVVFTFNAEAMEEGVHEVIAVLEFENEGMAPVEFSMVMSVESPVYAISGIVIDPADEDAAIENVLVEVDYFIMNRLTDGDGFYSFSDLPQQDYEFTYTAEDYLPFIQAVEPEEEGDVEQNVALLHSECTPNVDEILYEIPPDEMAEVQFRITNGGNGPLTYTAERRLVGDANAEPYSIRNELFVGADREDIYIRGVIYHNNRFYISGSNDRDPVIYVHDRDGEHIETFQQPIDHRSGMRDLAFDGEFLWGSIDNTMYGITLDGDVEAEFDLPYNPTTCVAYDPDHELLWVAGTTVGIIGLDRQGNEEADLDRHGLRMYGLSYWPDDPDGFKLYIYNMVRLEEGGNRPALHKMNTDDGDTMFVAWLDTERGGSALGSYITNQYDIYSWVMVSVTSAANNVGGDRIDIWQIDARKEWMQLEPVAGVIEADESEEFTLTFDATDLPEEQFEGELVFTHDGVSGETIIPLTLGVVEGVIHTTRTLDMHRGWNMVSVYLQPDEEDLEVIMGPLVEQDLLLMMKDGAGNFYRPDQEFNNIDGWHVEEGYLVKLSDRGELTLEGETVLSNEPIALEEGWQIISCYLRFPVDATLAFLNIADQMLIAKNEAGEFYIPEFDFSNMGNVMSLHGYQLKMSEAVDLVYRFQLDEEEDDRVLLLRGTRKPSRLGVHANTGSNMSLLVMFRNSISGDIGVFDGDNLVGSGVILDGKCGVTIWGDDNSTVANDGATEGAILQLMLFDGTNFTELNYESIRGDGIYETDGLWVVQLGNDVTLPIEFGIESIYPNPFNSSTLIRFSLPDASITNIKLYDLSGRLVQDQSLGRLTVGHHTATVDGAGFSSGIYIVELLAGSEVSRRKLTLIK